MGVSTATATTGDRAKARGSVLGRQTVIAIVGVALIIAIWWVDRFTPEEFRFGFVFMLPVAIVAWWCSRRVALACAALAAVALLSNDLAVSSDANAPRAAVAWNEFTRVVTLFAVALVITSVRASSERARIDSERA